MQLDHVIPSLTEGPIVKEAMLRSVRWLDRCKTAQKQQMKCSLFPIIQGGLDLKLREECVKEMVPRTNLGIAIGGLSGGEAKDTFWKIVAKCCELIPVNFYSCLFICYYLASFTSLCYGSWMVCRFSHCIGYFNLFQKS